MRGARYSKGCKAKEKEQKCGGVISVNGKQEALPPVNCLLCIRTVPSIFLDAKRF